MAHNIQESLSNIEQRVKKLVEKNARLQKDLEAKQQTIFLHLETIAKLQQQVKQHDNAIFAKTIASIDMNNVAGAKKEIEQHIKLLDKVIAQLQK